MKNKRKQEKRLKKSLNRRYKEQEKQHLTKAWRNIFVAAGVLEDGE